MTKQAADQDHAGIRYLTDYSHLKMLSSSSLYRKKVILMKPAFCPSLRPIADWYSIWQGSLLFFSVREKEIKENCS